MVLPLVRLGHANFEENNTRRFRNDEHQGSTLIRADLHAAEKRTNMPPLVAAEKS
jgi:hypothetical protein